MIITDSRVRARELGLPEDSSWIFLNRVEIERSRVKRAKALGLPEDVTWEVLDRAEQAAELLKLAKHFSMPESSGWMEINCRIMQDGDPRNGGNYAV